MKDLYPEVIRWEEVRESICPLDDADTARLQHVFNARVHQLSFRLNAIEVCMKQGKPPLLMLLHDDEGGALHGALHTEGSTEPLGEAGFPSAKVSDESDGGVGAGGSTEASPKLLGVAKRS